MKINIEIKIKVLPLWLDSPNKVLNSLWRVIIIIFQIKWYREGNSQYMEGININPINVLNQFKDILKILVVGSKTENKLVIIFSLMNYMLIY